MKEFKGKVAVVTGAASGIGRGIAERCVSEGMKVVLADIDEANLNQAETELKAQGGIVRGIKTDVSKRSDVELLARHVLDAFSQVHLLFNNAGVAAGGAPWEATWNDWKWVIDVNLWGVIHGVKVFTPLMLAQNTECHIINTSSMAGLIAGGGSAPYAVTKHAVIALSESCTHRFNNGTRSSTYRFSARGLCGQISPTPSVIGPRNCVTNQWQ